MNASDKTFVNDEAIVITDVAASDVVEKVHSATCIVANFFHRYDMVLNFCKGKTECIVKLRGLGSRSVKKRLAYCLDPDGVRVSVVPDVGVFGDVRLRIVDSYKHLGSHVSADGNCVPEASHRAASAMSAFVPLAGSLFGATSIGEDRRIRDGLVAYI